MTHVTNVQSFEKLVGICTGYGGAYNPGQQNLRIENLTALLMQAREKLLQVSITKTNHEQAQNAREIAFMEMRSLVSRIMAELRSTGALAQTIADATVMARKIRGYTKAEKPGAAVPQEGKDIEPEAGSRKRNSADFGNSAAYFEKLLQTLGSVPGYQPMKPELQLETLKARLAHLRSMNAAVVAAYAAWSNTRHERTNFMYLGPECMHDTAMAMKQQVKASFGNNSEAFALVRKIRFTKLLKK
jgi:hypothetical protein